MRQLLGSARVANLMAMLALFVALGGTSYAALTITGSNVKNGSLTGSDIKDSSITSSDVKNKSLLAKDFKSGQLPAGAKGPIGPQGPQGGQGGQGAKGDTGLSGLPSTALQAATTTVLASAGSNQTILTLNLQPGSYALFAKALLDNNDISGRAEVSCTLDAGTTVVDTDGTALRIDQESSTTGDRQFYVMEGTVSLPAATDVTIQCNADGGVNFWGRKIVAIKVGSLG